MSSPCLSIDWCYNINLAYPSRSAILALAKRPNAHHYIYCWWIARDRELIVRIAPCQPIGIVTAPDLPFRKSCSRTCQLAMRRVPAEHSRWLYVVELWKSVPLSDTYGTFECIPGRRLQILVVLGERMAAVGSALLLPQ